MAAPGLFDSTGQFEQQAELIADLRAQLEEAAPRLAAFAQLENLAVEQNSTPEAIAIQASLEVLGQEQAEIAQDVTRLGTERAEVESDLNRLVADRSRLLTEVGSAQAEYGSLVEETTELLIELESIRSDAVRLLGEKTGLDAHVDSLRNEVELLLIEREQLGGEGSSRSEGSAQSVRVGKATGASQFDSVDDSDEAKSFDKFFEVDLGKDKARAWMLE